VGSKANDEGRRKKTGRNDFDEHQNIKQNKGTGAQNHNNHGKATPSHLSSLVKHFFLHLWI
jgi:hypothetical protein